ncbi:MAG: D-2-hydroxyacid dehydrogenase [Desulfobacterales bacterium]|jgi:phosphoglycerate dehydrogenase-like enzyme
MTPLNRLLILTPDAQRYHELLRAQQPPDLEISICPQRTANDMALGQATIILGEPGHVAPVLARAGRLKWVQSTFAGVEALCRPDLPRNYRLTGVKGVFGPSMTEYVFAHILSLERHLAEMRANQQAKRWQRHAYGLLRKRTLGLCGLGAIGRYIAQTAAHFGMTVVAFKRTPGSDPLVERIYTGNEFGAFLGRLDYLVLTLPQTPASTHLINARTLAMLKPSAVLINIGRSNAVAEADLIAALSKGRIRGAVLDVFDQEPLPRDNPLWELPNAVITPHQAGISFPENILPIFMENYRRFLAGAPLKYEIDFIRGY